MTSGDELVKVGTGAFLLGAGYSIARRAGAFGSDRRRSKPRFERVRLSRFAPLIRQADTPTERDRLVAARRAHLQGRPEVTLSHLQRVENTTKDTKLRGEIRALERDLEHEL